MKTSRGPAVVLGLLYLCFLGYLAMASGQLPDRVATHFDGSGQPNGWMSRSSHLWFTLVLGLAFPLIGAVLLFCTRFLPDNLINIPRRDYWLSAERRDDTFAYLFRQSLWFACIGVCFVTAIQFLIVRANLHAPGQLSTPLLFAVTGGFLLALAMWAISTILHFRRVA
jgi:ABC-type Fe3+ transport system permease subunit